MLIGRTKPQRGGCEVIGKRIGSEKYPKNYLRRVKGVTQKITCISRTEGNEEEKASKK